MKKLFIFDFYRTLFNPKTFALTEYAKETLEVIKKRGDVLVLLTRKEQGRENIIDASQISQYFSEVALVDEKTPEIINDLVVKYQTTKERTYIIGDYIPHEIVAGNIAGVITIWLQQGKFADYIPALPEEFPTYTIKSLKELFTII